jgi:hypothetical protein
MYGDSTYAADLSTYRAEILHWTRPACANEEDDDGDGATDFPADPGCETPGDDDERERGLASKGLRFLVGAVGATLAVGGALAYRRGRREVQPSGS